MAFENFPKTSIFLSKLNDEKWFKRLWKMVLNGNDIELEINKKIDRNPAACVSPILIKNEYAIKGKNKIKTW